VAKGNTQWFVLDLETRKPVRPDAVLDPRFPRERTPPVLEPSHARLPPLPTWDFQKRFHIRYADIDVNLHVNNGSYVAWALEAIPRDVWQSSRLASLDVQYLAECHYGSAVLSRHARAGDRAFHHAIVREEDEKELARVATAWVAR
jgi:medium-chain acyl-[acyl-carrier-protein] hydrolase